MANLSNSAFDGLSEGVAEQIIQDALESAIDIMLGMCSNEGQASVMNNYIIPDFRSNAEADPYEGWSYVNAGDYMTFVGEIVEAGNAIMDSAYQIAKKILQASSVI